jgi:hypothetical protein
MDAMHAPGWLDFAALDRCIAVAVDGQKDDDLRTAMIAAIERADAELMFTRDAVGDWVLVIVSGQSLTRVHRSRVQKIGAN